MSDNNYLNNAGYNYPNHGNNYATTSISQVMKRVYLKMTLALVVTALISMFCAGSMGYMQFIATHSWFMWVLMGVEVLIVIGVSGATQKISDTAATLLFYAFAIINGLALAPIFLIYTGTSIAKTFFITAATFAAMTIYGYCTNQDLSKFGAILFMALIGLIIASVVNIFWANSTFEWIISIAGVIIFVGLTAWDTQQIKNMIALTPYERVGRVATIGALSLYLDFINLFLYLLRIFGSRND